MTPEKDIEVRVGVVPAWCDREGHLAFGIVLN